MFCKHFARFEDGAIAILVALLLPVLIGFGVLAYEVGYWYQTQQNIQQIADIASFGGATERSLRGASGVTARSTYLASLNNFTAGSDNTITINNPPASGSYTSDNNAVEVLMTQPVTRSLANYFSSSAITTHSRSVATKTGGPACIYAFSTTASGAVTFSGTSGLNAPTCGIKDNSSDPSSIKVNGNPNITAAYVDTVGGSSVVGNPSVNTPSGQIKTGALAAGNPFSSLTVPNYSSCTFTNTKITGGSTVVLSPGTYCGGISIASSANVTLNSGTYIVDGGSFSVGGNANVTGTGVTVILSGKISGNYATASLTGNGTVNLTAPTTGSFANIAFFQDPNAPSGGTNSFVGTSNQNITGVLYFPKQDLKFAGNTATSSPCTVLAANTVSFVGTANIQCNAGSLGGLVTPGTIAIVE